MTTVEQMSEVVPVRGACAALNVAPASYYRWKNPPSGERVDRRRPPLVLSAGEETAVLADLHSERFMDLAPAEVYATLLEEGTYHCSLRTMYRVLDRHAEVRDRRNQLRHPVAAKPELLATGPNQVWSWDITMLKGPVKWTYFYLYVILDIFSRYAVGWLIAPRESAALAEQLIEASCQKHNVDKNQLTLHADRGPSMTSQTVAQLLARLSITKSHSRPYTSNDNPFSEAMFKTLKYRPGFPERFGAPEDAIGFGRSFFPWYNTEHRHAGIGYLTPEVVHYGQAAEVLAARAAALRQAYEANPSRFKNRPPTLPAPPTEVWINPPPARKSDGQPRIDVYSWPAIDAMKSAQGTGVPGIAVDTAAVKHNDDNEATELIVLH
jgi:putative transposase